MDEDGVVVISGLDSIMDEIDGLNRATLDSITSKTLLRYGDATSSPLRDSPVRPGSPPGSYGRPCSTGRGSSDRGSSG
jgi:hypothetical protein